MPSSNYHRSASLLKRGTIFRNTKYLGSSLPKISSPAPMYAHMSTSAARSVSPLSYSAWPRRKCRNGLPIASGQVIAYSRASFAEVKNPPRKQASPIAASTHVAASQLIWVLESAPTPGCIGRWRPFSRHFPGAHHPLGKTL